MNLFPKEHGAYGQVAFPLVTALAVSGVTVPALLLGAAVLAVFLAHEPLVVLLGFRGQRARRERAAVARLWLAVLGVTATSAAAIAFLFIPVSQRWALAVPAAAAVPAIAAVVTGREKTWPGEVAVSLAFSGAAFPMAIAAGAPRATAATIALVYALSFVLATFAVRVVILRARAGGHPAAVTASRRSVVLLACGALAAFSAACVAESLPWTALFASTPSVVVSLYLASNPPAPAKLRTVGWSLVAASTATLVVLIGGL